MSTLFADKKWSIPGYPRRDAALERLRARMFGSAARGDMWPVTSPMHSDIDLLVVTRGEVPEGEQEELLNETYPLYLECGRQLSPHFFSEQRISERVAVAVWESNQT